MSGIDERIRQALQDDAEEKYISSGDDQAMLGMMLSTFRGRNRWWMVLMSIYTFIFLVAAVFCAVQFYQATETKDLIMWASAVLMAMMAVSMLKMWMFMQMDKNSVLREIKRLELQVAKLASKTAGESK